MKVAEGSLGRVFVLRLEDGERLPECIEAFARERGVSRAFCALVGGVDGGTIVTGPVDGGVMPPVPVLTALTGAQEVAAVGTLFPDADGQPRLHMHGAFGRGQEALVGCIRPGIEVWTIGEFVIIELLGLDMTRRRDQATGFELLCDS
ncbi:MAG: DNA-binding protein [Humidesulfovibrio sp.]|uniref:PPC domain-containing DNA-binding protein n=1 Tax=Humidesulfovibrio sp. TaxID=2910988 RepID=UPI0027FC44B9|nr:DNA-binding protein [Humidesulfovibrio sp.]MDQ7835436.1 DNA-binding protein [Humidesulfovibrio sp.]